MKKSLFSIAIATVLVAPSGAAFGDVLTFDLFNYVGPLTDNGWTAHSGAGNKVIMADGAVATLEQSIGSGEDVNRSFDPLGATDKIYAAFDLSVDPADLTVLDGSGLYVVHFKTDDFVFRGHTGVVQSPGRGDWGLAINADASNLGAGATWPVDLEFDTFYRVVISWDAGSGESELWVNPTVETDPSITHTGARSGDLIEAFALRQSNDYDGFQRIDNVFVGRSFDDVVVPEPLGCLRDPEWLCDGDVDGDGQVNPVDSGLVQAAFGSTYESDLCQYDVDCDGQINPVDSGIVQSLFGTCEKPREVCP